MKGTAKIENPEDVNITIEATMTMREWKEVAEHLRGFSYNFSRLIRVIVERTGRLHSQTLEDKGD